MKKILSLFVVAAVACGGVASDNAAADNLDANGVNGAHEPPMLGVHYAKGGSHGGGSGSPDMTSHGGTIMPTAATQVIFWGASWADPNFAGDKIKGIDSWYTGFGGSNYAATSNEYKGSNGQVGSSVSYFGSQVDTSAAPKGAPKTSAILAEVCSHITNPVTSGYYAVYVDTPRGHAGYCAWHSWGQCNGVNVQFAFFFNLDNDPNCSPDVNNGHSQGLAALANVSGHELSEARTDPRGDGWFDSSGEENGDKCAWAFNVPSVTFSNGTKWQIQGEWSNHAYDTNTGYPNLSGQNGCLDGH